MERNTLNKLKFTWGGKAMAFNPEEYLITLVREKKDRDTGKTVKVKEKYLESAYRVMWWNEDHPIDSGWRLVTECIVDNGEWATYKASIINPEGVVVRTAHKTDYADEYDYYADKAETQAIGRVLALAGYGTQYAVRDLDEADGFADAPVTVEDEPPFDVDNDEEEDTKEGKKIRRKKLVTKKTLNKRKAKKKASKEEEKKSSKGISLQNKKTINTMLKMINEENGFEWTLKDVSQEKLGKDEPETEEEAEKIISHLADLINELKINEDIDEDDDEDEELDEDMDEYSDEKGEEDENDI